MKKPFCTFDALFLFFLYFKASGKPFFYGTISWLVVVSPYLFETVLVVIKRVADHYSWEARLRLALWKVPLNFKRRKLARKFKAELKETIK